ncbi:uncharacterized protein LOC128197325 isoform X1 [Vigna angularis]|uniref:uncharacterized protein LOC128197325 isoform X1 n=1 Tax=Phaseolus angularis TaxID=3914 RepID=UPI0022B2CD09|nr:uncharacterized protein LOC128197325 isoform X1 [Vigna angularis]
MFHFFVVFSVVNCDLLFVAFLQLRSVSIVQTEPIVVHITFDLVLEENSDFDASLSLNYFASSVASTKGSGYGFADKIADGMTIQIQTIYCLKLVFSLSWGSNMVFLR